MRIGQLTEFIDVWGPSREVWKVATGDLFKSIPPRAVNTRINWTRGHCCHIKINQNNEFKYQNTSFVLPGDGLDVVELPRVDPDGDIPLPAGRDVA